MNALPTECPLGVGAHVVLSAEQFTMLEELEKYDLWFVIERLERKKFFPLAQIEQAVVEFKRYVALIGLGYTGLSMRSYQVDEVWHNFILFTHEYDEFCRHTVGQFIHHAPRTSRRLIPKQHNENFVTAYMKVFGELPVMYQELRRHEQSLSECEGSNCSNCDS